MAPSDLAGLLSHCASGVICTDDGWMGRDEDEAATRAQTPSCYGTLHSGNAPKGTTPIAPHANTP